MKVLIIGASGFLGENLSYILKKKHVVYGTYFNNLTFNLDTMYQLDACKLGNTKRILEEIKPEIVVWSIMTRSTETKIMEIALSEVLDYTRTSNSRVIYISTDLFKGEGSYYKEDYEAKYFDYKNPYAQYFNGKVLGEQMVLEDKKNTVVRIGMIYGLDYFNNYDKRINHMREQINSNEKIELSKNVYKTYTNIRLLVEIIKELIEIDYKGVLHVVNTRRLSIYDFYKEQLENIGIKTDLLTATFVDESEAHENDLCLDTSMSFGKLLMLIESGQICTSYNTLFTNSPQK